MRGELPGAGDHLAFDAALVPRGAQPQERQRRHCDRGPGYERHLDGDPCGQPTSQQPCEATDREQLDRSQAGPVGAPDPRQGFPGRGEDREARYRHRKIEGTQQQDRHAGGNQSELNRHARRRRRTWNRISP